MKDPKKNVTYRIREKTIQRVREAATKFPDWSINDMVDRALNEWTNQYLPVSKKK
jgi:hypothetical protein